MQLMKRLLLVSLLACAGPGAWAAAPADKSLQGHILGIPGDAVEVDMDVFHELKPGDLGTLRRNGARIASVEVVRMDQDNVYLRALDNIKGFTPQAGDTAYFVAEHKKAAPAAVAGAGLGEEELVPLLTPLPQPVPEKKKLPYTVSTRFHGRAMLRQFYQELSPGSENQRVTRIDTDGTIDRIGGGPWAFTWSGNGSYADGSRRSVSNDFRRFQPRARRLTLSRALADGGFIHAGRFFPRELPGLGTVDGLAAEVPVSGLRLGAVAGARPDRRDQGFASHELLGSLYAAAEKGTPGQGSYAATLGVMHTTWLGKSDELAALLDQNFDLGPALSVYETAQVDFNAGAARTHKGARLTRLDVSLNSNVKKWLVLRGGLSHYEPVDVEAERAFIGGDAPFRIDNGYWRFWGGAMQTLPSDFGMDEEISWTRTEGKLQPGLWRATLWHQGLPGLADGRTYVTGYNATGVNGTDYGGAAGVTVPMFAGKFVVDADTGFHYDKGASSARNLRLSDASLRLDWRPGRTWQLDATGTKVWRGSSRSASVSAGLTYRW